VLCADLVREVLGLRDLYVPKVAAAAAAATSAHGTIPVFRPAPLPDAIPTV